MVQIRNVMWLLVHVYEDIDDIETSVSREVECFLAFLE